MEDVALGDLNGDGWLDIVAACEDAHLVYFENPGIDHRAAPWPALIPGIAKGRLLASRLRGGYQWRWAARSDRCEQGRAGYRPPEAGDPDNGATSLITFSGPAPRK